MAQSEPDITSQGDTPLRIIQVVNVRWFNATAWYGLFLSRLLKEAGHEVLVLGLEGTDSFAKAQEWGLNPRHLDLNARNPIQWPGLVKQTCKIIHEFKPDIVNCHRGEGFVLWGLLKNLGKGYALVRTRGDQRLPRHNLPNRLLHSKLADAVITTNSAMTRHFVQEMHLDPQKISTILGGVDNNIFYPKPELREKMRAEFGYSQKDFVLGLVGRLDEVKGQKELIQAVADLHNQGYQHLRLLLLGFSSANSEDEVQAWIKEKDLEQYVQISGKRPDIADCMQALDLGVVPSLWSEAIARAALELMACGIPIVGNRVGVMPDLLPDKALARPGNIKDLDLLLQYYIQHPQAVLELKNHAANLMRGLGAKQFLSASTAVYNKVITT